MSRSVNDSCNPVFRKLYTKFQVATIAMFFQSNCKNGLQYCLIRSAIKPKIIITIKKYYKKDKDDYGNVSDDEDSKQQDALVNIYNTNREMNEFVDVLVNKNHKTKKVKS